MPDLFFRQRGKGYPLVLVHGFPFNQTLWDNFADHLSDAFKVFTIDLPGFGQSALPSNSFSIDDVGQILISWMREHVAGRPVLVGHSLGGYIALSVAAQDPALISGLGLFHSTAMPDTDEKKRSRDKVIDFVESHGALAFTSNFIEPLFADPGHRAVGLVRTIASAASREAVVGYTKAMRDRPDRRRVLGQYSRPVMFIAGEKDPGITVESIHEQAVLCQLPEVHVLSNVGHMGMFENEKTCLEIVRKFVVKSQLPAG